MKDINIISFDVEGTLVTTDFSAAIWFEGIPQSYAARHGISTEAATKILISEYEKISDQRMEWYDVNYWLKRFDLGSPSVLLSRYRDRIKYYPEVSGVLSALSQKYTLIVASGTPRDFLGHLLTEINSYFAQIFSSTSDYKSVKNRNFYSSICQEMKTQPHKIVHVGDNRQFDYESAQEAGMQSYYLNRSAAAEHQYTLNSLSELIDLLL